MKAEMKDVTILTASTGVRSAITTDGKIFLEVPPWENLLQIVSELDAFEAEVVILPDGAVCASKAWWVEHYWQEPAMASIFDFIAEQIREREEGNG